MTRNHFRTLYHNEYMRLIKYDGSQLSQIRDFSHSQFLTVMVMTMAAFNKVTNNIYKPTQKLMGEKLPFEYIQEVRPIFILDECQNYETDTAKQALRTMHPLFAIKYSATAGVKDESGVWQYDNLLYQLDPLAAFRNNLVKRIQVFGVTEGSNANEDAPIRIKEFSSGPKVKVEVIVNKKGRREKGTIALKGRDDIRNKTKNEDYDGYVVDNIDLNEMSIEFINGYRLVAKTEQQEAEEKKEVFRKQIDETVKQHMNLQEQLLEQKIKVLSLFFIDRVANYRGEEAIIKELFEEIFDKYKKGYECFKEKQADKVHDGYFAKKVTKEGEEEIDTEGGKNNAEREAEKRAFELIMRDKERMLSMEEHMSFIFAHSALKEGWDNPNVFQICTLAQRYSERRKRQEIGRGMRLCVDQDGDRIQDSKVNVLTVIANESYEDFVEGLQSEYRDTGNALPPPPSNAVRQPAKRNKKIFEQQEFVQFWNHLIQRTDYGIKIDTEKMINNVVASFSKEIISPPEIIVRKGAYGFIRYGIYVENITGDKVKIKVVKQDSDGDDEKFVKTYKKKSDLSKELNDKALDGFVIVEVRPNEIVFANGQILQIGQSIEFESMKAIKVQHSVHWEKDKVFPVFDVIERVAHETMLTRKTVIEIFKRISDGRKKGIFQNPEGFAGSFIFSIKEVLANHVAKNVEYFLIDEIESYDFGKIFPAEELHPQHQLTKGAEASLYDYVQYESDVEKRFVENRLNSDRKVICYFKFPDSFKIKLPKIIGNYVPDWGIVRMSEANGYSVELVRETKGNLDLNLLQYRNEPRKIMCAKKHFKILGVDYRHIDNTVDRWWEPDTDEEQFLVDTLLENIEIVGAVEASERFITHLPVFDLEAVATNFGSEEYESINPKGWIKADIGKNLNKDMFVAKVVGKSMETTIKDGSWCVFRRDIGGSREGKIVLANCVKMRDPESQGTFTIKRYHSEKEFFDDGTWRHKRIVLSPDNKDFDDIILEDVSEDEFFIAGELFRIL